MRYKNCKSTRRNINILFQNNLENMVITWISGNAACKVPPQKYSTELKQNIKFIFIHTRNREEVNYVFPSSKAKKSEFLYGFLSVMVCFFFHKKE